MPWRDVYLTLAGLRQKEEPFRKLGQIVIDLMVKERPELHKNGWRLPLDGPTEEKHQSSLEWQMQFMKQRKAEILELKQKQQNGNN